MEHMIDFCKEKSEWNKFLFDLEYKTVKHLRRKALSSQKFGSEPAQRVRLQTSNRCERSLLRKRRNKEAGRCFSAKENGAKRTLLRHGGATQI